MIKFTPLNPMLTRLETADMLGFIPYFLDADDPDPAKEQIDKNYQHGGGWRTFTGFEHDPETKSIQYPGDPKLHPIASAKLRDETIFVYPYAWVMIVQPGGSWEIARID